MSRPLLNFGGDSTEQKWQSWLEVVSGELTEADAARKLGVVVSVIIKLRKVAKDACLSAFAALPPSSRIEQIAEQPPLVDVVTRLRVIKGIDTLSAVTVAAEVSDFTAFATAAAFMAYVGWYLANAPPGNASGGGRSPRPATAISDASSSRRPWAYRHRLAVGAHLRRRHTGLPAEFVAYSWKAQQRLHARYRTLGATKHPNVAVVGVARELAGFVWAIGTERYPR